MISKWIARVIENMTRKSHDVKLQLLGATIFGLVSIFGVGGAVVIMLKARKLTKVKGRGTTVVTKKM